MLRQWKSRPRIVGSWSRDQTGVFIWMTDAWVILYFLAHKGTGCESTNSLLASGPGILRLRRWILRSDTRRRSLTSHHPREVFSYTSDTSFKAKPIKIKWCKNWTCINSVGYIPFCFTALPMVRLKSFIRNRSMATVNMSYELYDSPNLVENGWPFGDSIYECSPMNCCSCCILV